MGRQRKKPSTPTLPPEWVDTPAQNAGCEIRTIAEPGKSGIRRRHRDHLLEVMAKPRKYGNTTKPAQITPRQRDAGIRLLEAWCETQRSPEQSGNYVQNSPDWDAIALNGVERIWDFQEVSQHLPQQYRDAVLTAVVNQIIPDAWLYEQWLSDLRAGLDAIADGLRLPGG